MDHSSIVILESAPKTEIISNNFEEVRKLEITRNYFTLEFIKKPGKYDHYLQNNFLKLKVASPGQLRGIQISFSKFKQHGNKNLEENGKMIKFGNKW